jgi:hypothetical protein
VLADLPDSVEALSVPKQTQSAREATRRPATGDAPATKSSVDRLTGRGPRLGTCE